LLKWFGNHVIDFNRLRQYSLTVILHRTSKVMSREDAQSFLNADPEHFHQMSSWRLGGWIMTIDEAKAWASRVKGKPAESMAFGEAFAILIGKLQPFNIDVACVTYPASVTKVMIVTRRAPWAGWRLGDDPTKLPQYSLGKREELARKALEKQGELVNDSTTVRATY
jgi:hypothetical protein